MLDNSFNKKIVVRIVDGFKGVKMGTYDICRKIFGIEAVMEAWSSRSKAKIDIFKVCLLGVFVIVIFFAENQSRIINEQIPIILAIIYFFSFTLIQYWSEIEKVCKPKQEGNIYVFVALALIIIVTIIYLVIAIIGYLSNYKELKDIAFAPLVHMSIYTIMAMLFIGIDHALGNKKAFRSNFSIFMSLFATVVIVFIYNGKSQHNLGKIEIFAAGATTIHVFLGTLLFPGVNGSNNKIKMTKKMKKINLRKKIKTDMQKNELEHSS